MIYDISPLIDGKLQVWPGDTAPSRETLCDIEEGSNITLSTLHATVHLGSHADAPVHYGKGAPSMAERSLDYYLGRCQVVSVDVGRGQRISPDHLKEKATAERILFRTGTYPDPTVFNEDFAAFSPELIDLLHESGVRLIGIDTPSVDLFASKGLPAHQALLRHDMANLEGLVLKDVPDGTYDLCALPLKLKGYDGSPVRAVLRSL